MEDLNLNPTPYQSPNFNGLMNINGLSDFMNSNDGPNVKPISIDQFSNQYSGLKPVQLDLHNPDYSNQFIDRYKELNAYDKYGFDPTRDNEAFYNQHTSGWDNFQRAFGEMGGMIGTSMFDTLTFGAFSDETAEKMKIANAIGQSTKGGAGAFALNTMVSAGYTLGIVFESLLEEAALALGTMATGGLASGVAAAETTRNAGRVGKALYDFANVIKNQSRLTKTMNNIDNIHDLSSFATSVKNLINPLENTFAAVQDIRSMENMKNSAKAMNAFAGVWRDVTDAKLVATESMLEGNFAEQELRSKLIDEFISKNGRKPNEEEMKSIDENAVAANLATAAMNAPMIHLTNKLTFGLMTRPIRSLESSFLKAGGGMIISSVDKTTGKRVFKELSSGFWKKQLELAKNPKYFLKNALTYSTDNFVEGFQEIAQDAISSAAKEMYGDRYNNSVRGSWYNYLAQGAKGQLSGQGLETFLSGFAMQMFIKPITSIGGFISQGGHMENNTLTGKIVNSVEDTANKIFRSEESYKKYNEGKYGYYRDKVDEKGNVIKKPNGETDKEFVDGWMNKFSKQREEIVEQLNEFFSTPEGIKEYFNGNFDAMLSSGQFANLYENQKDEKGNDRVYTDEEKKNIIKNHYTQLFTNAIQHNQFDAIIDTLNSMKNMSDDDLAKAWSKETKDVFKQNIDVAINHANQTKRRYDEATKNMKRPHSDENIKRVMEVDSEKGIQMMFENFAYDKAIKAYIYNLEGFEDGLEKQKKIMEEAAKIFNANSSPLSYTDFTTLYDRNSIIAHINDLKGRLNGVNGGYGLLSIQNPDEATKKLIKDSQDQLEILEKISDLSQKAAQDSIKDSDGNEIKKTNQQRQDDIENLTNAVKDYLSVLSKSQGVSVDTEELRQLSNAIAAYNVFTAENKVYNQNINILSDPKSLSQYILNEAEILKYINEHKKEEIRESLKKFDEQQKIDKVIKKLASKGIFIPYDEYQKMLQTKKMTTHIYSKNSKTNEFEEVTFGSKEMKEAFKVIREELLKEGSDIEYIPIPEGGIGGSVGLRNDKSRRTMDDIMKEYDIKTDGTTYSLDEIAEKIIDTKHKHSATTERALLKAMLPLLSGYKIKFVDNQNTQFYFDGINTISLDLRYFSREFGNSDNWKNGTIRFEFGFCKAAVSLVTQQGLKKNKDFNDNIERLRKLASDYYSKLSKEDKEKYQEIKDQSPYGLDSNEDFVVEAMCNKNFQALLRNIEDDKPVSEVDNVFTKFIEEVYKFLQEVIPGIKNDVLHSSLYVISDYLNSPILPITPEQAGNVSKQLLSTNDSIEGLKAKAPDELIHKLVQLYKYEHASDKSLQTKSDKVILKSEEFKNWFHRGNEGIERILNEFNSSILNNVTPEDLEINDISLYDMTPDEINGLSEGKVSNTRKFIIASKLLNNQTLDVNEKEAYEKYAKKEIDEMVKNFSDIENYKGPGGIETKEDFVKYCNKKLGYNISVLNSLSLNDLKRIVIANISSGERSESVKNNVKREEKHNTILDSMKNDFDNCTTMDELNNEKAKYMSIFSNNNYQCGFTYDELMNLYNSAKNRIISEDMNETFKALSTPFTLFELFNDNNIYIVLDVLCRNGRRKVVYQRIDNSTSEIDKNDEIKIAFLDDLSDNVKDVISAEDEALYVPEADYLNDVNDKLIQLDDDLQKINESDGNAQINKMHDEAKKSGFKIVTFNKKLKESDIFESIKNSCK